MRAAGLAAILAACWTSSSAPVVAPQPDPQPPIVLRSKPTKSPCAVAIDHVLEISHAELDQLTDGPEKLAQIRDTAIDSCVEQRWSEESIHCFDDIADNSALAACQALLTQDQTSDLWRRITEVLQPPAPPPISP